MLSHRLIRATRIPLFRTPARFISPRCYRAVRPFSNYQRLFIDTKDGNASTLEKPTTGTTKPSPYLPASPLPESPKEPTGPVSTSTESSEPSDSEKDDFMTTIFGDMEPYLDTYGIYTNLVEAGFSDKQADQILNLLVAQLNHKLSSLEEKYSHIYKLENENYLFVSAQQELRVDVTRSREQHINELFALISTLERDFNILMDELNSECIQMKNDNQVAINDQKSENTLQSKKIMLRIQETNHKITTELNSAMRSEIETLRWHLSRWGVMAILVSVFSACAFFYMFKMKSNEKQTKNEFFPLIIHEPSEYDDDDYHSDIDENIVR